MKLTSYKLYFQMPTGLVFGPCRAPPPKFRRMKTATRKAWYWSLSERNGKGKRKVWSKSASERKRKAKLPERNKKREDLSRKKREDLLKTRKERREEEKQRKKDAGEPLVTKKNAKNLKSHHGAEQVDATILRLLGRLERLARVPKTLDTSAQVNGVS